MIAEPRLITPAGAYDRAAIIAEVGRRCAAQFEKLGWANREFHERQVNWLARQQQFPIFDAFMLTQWTPAEREAELDFLARADAQPQTITGNRRFDELRCKAAEIRAVVFDRATARFESGEVTAIAEE